MKHCIAMPLMNGKLSAHFGHAETFVFVSLDTDEPNVRTQREEKPPKHEPGVLPRWLHEQGATAILAGGMGQRAVELLKENGIDPVLGLSDITIDEAIEKYLANALPRGASACTAHEGNCDH